MSDSVAHKDRSHAVLGPSSSDRWVNCPGSVALSDGKPNKGSYFADEGTAAHELANHCLATGFDAERFLGGSINIRGHSPVEIIREFPPREGETTDEGVFPVTEEMADAVQVYLDECRQYRPEDGWEILFEQRVYISEKPEINGTCDFAAYHPVHKILVVIDLKFGRHVSVEAFENTQTICYAIGTLKRMHNRGVGKMIIKIVQPRDGGPPVRSWEPDTIDMFDWEAELIEAGQKAEYAVELRRAGKPLDPVWFTVGDHCRFCPALGECETHREHMFKLADAQFEVVGDENGEERFVAKFPDPAELSDDHLADLLDNLERFNNWKNAVVALAHERSEQGRQIPGWKLVQKRATRRWNDEGEAAMVLDMHGIHPYQPAKMMSPAMVEKQVPGKNKDERKAWLAKLCTAKSSGTVLAREDDSRDAIRRAADDQFEDLRERE